MGNTPKNMLDALRSDEAKEAGVSTLSNLTAAITTHDPLSALMLLRDGTLFVTTVRDAMLFESFKNYLTHLNRDREDGSSGNRDMRTLAERLAAASPNHEAGYEGDPKALTEYAKRLIRAIDDCDTELKARYLANLTRALENEPVDTKKFFQLARCIRSLTDEDLIYLRDHIGPGSISGDEDFIDDYRAVGLVMEVDGGFSYTSRAYDFANYVLNYDTGRKVRPPEQLPQRAVQEAVTEEQIQQMINDSVNVEGETVSWGKF